MKGKSAFDWDVYKNRKTALQYLKRHRTLVDTLIETEDGSMHECVHSQVISAFGEKFTEFIEQNGQHISLAETGGAGRVPAATASSSGNKPTTILLKSIRLPRVTDYTLRVLIECAYTGVIRTDLGSGGIWQVLDVADYYEMSEVIKACCAFLLKNLSSSNCVYLYHVGIKYKHQLQRSAWHKIRANFKHILAQNLLDSSNDLLRNGILGPNWDMCNGQLNVDLIEQKRNNLATIKFEHFEPLLAHDKLNTDTEESVWSAIKLWCNFNLLERSSRVAQLLPCMRFPRFRTGIDFSARHIWRDPLVIGSRAAQQQLAILDRNHRDYLASGSLHYLHQSSSSSGSSRQQMSSLPMQQVSRDGFGLPCAYKPRQFRPRIPHSILLAIGGWQSGQPTTLIESYDSNCNLWFESKRRIMSPLAYHGIEYINGLLYICGGTDGSEILNEMFTFDPVRGDCAQKPPMRDSRCYVSTAQLNGYLYAMGGHNGVQRMRSVERFDLKEESWAHSAEMNVARSDASACVHKSCIYIAGGLNDQAIESSIEFYNSQDNSWTFITSMLAQRTSFTLLAYQDSLLAIGGNNGSERLNSVEQYNFATKLWSPHSQMRHRRSTFSAAIVDDSKLIVVGGYNGQTPFAQVEMYDASSRTWVPLTKIKYDRSGLRVVVVSDLPNATEYTYLGQPGSTYITADDNKFVPLATTTTTTTTTTASNNNSNNN